MTTQSPTSPKNPTRDAVLRALDRVVDPCSIATGVPVNLNDMGLIQRVDVEEQDVTVVLQLTSPLCWQLTSILARIEDVVGDLDNVRTVRCEVDPLADWGPEMMTKSVRDKLQRVVSDGQTQPVQASGACEA